MENRGISPATGEEALIAQAVDGDLAAFNQLVLAYQNLAYSVAYRTPVSYTHLDWDKRKVTKYPRLSHATA